MSLRDTQLVPHGRVGEIKGLGNTDLDGGMKVGGRSPWPPLHLDPARRRTFGEVKSTKLATRVVATAVLKRALVRVCVVLVESSDEAVPYALNAPRSQAGHGRLEAAHPLGRHVGLGGDPGGNPAEQAVDLPGADGGGFQKA